MFISRLLVQVYPPQVVISMDGKLLNPSNIEGFEFMIEFANQIIANNVKS